MQNWNDFDMDRVARRIRRQAQGVDGKKAVVLLNIIAGAIEDELDYHGYERSPNVEDPRPGAKQSADDKATARRLVASEPEA